MNYGLVGGSLQDVDGRRVRVGIEDLDLGQGQILSICQRMLHLNGFTRNRRIESVKEILLVIGKVSPGQSDHRRSGRVIVGNDHIIGGIHYGDGDILVPRLGLVRHKKYAQGADGLR